MTSGMFQACHASIGAVMHPVDEWRLGSPAEGVAVALHCHIDNAPCVLQLANDGLVRILYKPARWQRTRFSKTEQALDLRRHAGTELQQWCNMHQRRSHALKVRNLFREAAVGIQGAGQFAALLDNACIISCQLFSARLRALDADSSCHVSSLACVHKPLGCKPHQRSLDSPCWMAMR